MSELEEPLPARFAEHVDTVYRALDALQPRLERAVEELADLLLAERRLVVCGLGTGAALAQLFAAGLLGRMRMERPGLPVMVLGSDAAVLGAVVEAYGPASALARPLQALLQRGDAVLLVCAGAGAGGGAALAAAARAAHARDARVIVLSGEDGADAGVPGRGDIELRVPSDDPARVAECQLLLLNCLAELIEERLFGAA